MTDTNCCILCNSSEDNTSDFGDLIVKNGIVVHYCCLLLSPALYTRADEENGFYGFPPDDILTEKKRIKGQKCAYCSKSHANLSCSRGKCRHSFHLKCGLQNGCLYKFNGNYETFCRQDVVKRLQKHDENECCAICYEMMGNYNQTTSIFADCCKVSWYHRECLAKFAHSSGYFFKCPLCNEGDKFKEMVAEQGIFCPERDAAWELEPGAFSDQLERPTECSAKICLCRKGRKYDELGPWEIVYCVSCGGKAIHDRCFPHGHLNFYCDICIDVGADKLMKKCLETIDEDDASECDEAPEIRKCTIYIENLNRIYTACDHYKKYYPFKNLKWVKLNKFKTLPSKSLSSDADSSKEDSFKGENECQDNISANFSSPCILSDASETPRSLTKLYFQSPETPSSSKEKPSNEKSLQSTPIIFKRKLSFDRSNYNEKKKHKIEATSSKSQSLITSFLTIKQESPTESDLENNSISSDIIRVQLQHNRNKKPIVFDKRQPLIHNFFNRITNN